MNRTGQKKIVEKLTNCGDSPPPHLTTSYHISPHLITLHHNITSSLTTSKHISPHHTKSLTKSHHNIISSLTTSHHNITASLPAIHHITPQHHLFSHHITSRHTTSQWSPHKSSGDHLRQINRHNIYWERSKDPTDMCHYRLYMLQRIINYKWTAVFLSAAQLTQETNTTQHKTTCKVSKDPTKKRARPLNALARQTKQRKQSTLVAINLQKARHEWREFGVCNGGSPEHEQSDSCQATCRLDVWFVFHKPEHGAWEVANVCL